MQWRALMCLAPSTKVTSEDASKVTCVCAVLAVSVFLPASSACSCVQTPLQCLCCSKTAEQLQDYVRDDFVFEVRPDRAGLCQFRGTDARHTIRTRAPVAGTFPSPGPPHPLLASEPLHPADSCWLLMPDEWPATYFCPGPLLNVPAACRKLRQSAQSPGPRCSSPYGTWRRPLRTLVHCVGVEWAGVPRHRPRTSCKPSLKSHHAVSSISTVLIVRGFALLQWVRFQFGLEVTTPSPPAAPHPNGTAVTTRGPYRHPITESPYACAPFALPGDVGLFSGSAVTKEKDWLRASGWRCCEVERPVKLKEVSVPRALCLWVGGGKTTHFPSGQGSYVLCPDCTGLGNCTPFPYRPLSGRDLASIQSHHVVPTLVQQRGLPPVRRYRYNHTTSRCPLFPLLVQFRLPPPLA